MAYMTYADSVFELMVGGWVVTISQELCLGNLFVCDCYEVLQCDQ